MDLKNPFYVDVLDTLSKAKVQYILVGGLAVSYHGYSRYTGDMDLWVRPEAQNMNRLYDALSNMGYSKDVIQHIKTERDVENPTPIKLKDDNNFSKKISWEECFSKSEMIRFSEVEIPVIHIDHLIVLKENTKRLDNSMKDLVDAQELKKIKKMKKK